MTVGTATGDVSLRHVLATHGQDTAGYYAALRRLGGDRGIFWDADLRAWVVTGHALCSELFSSPELTKSRLRLGERGVHPQLATFARRAQAIVDLQMTFDDSPEAARSHGDWSRLLHTGRDDEFARVLAGNAEAAWAMFAQGADDFHAAALRPYVSRAIAEKLALAEPERAAVYPLVYGYADFLDGKEETGSEMGAALSVVLLGEYVTARLPALRRCAKEPIADERRWIADYILTLVAGHESTAYALGVSLAEACARPQALRSPAAIRRHLIEALRYDSPIQMVGRMARDSIAVGGVTMRPGERVFLHIGAANRDPRQFEAPDEFRPGRDARDLLAFGRGASRCIGMSLSLLQAEIFLGVAARPMAKQRLTVRSTRYAHGLAGRSFDHLSLAGAATAGS